MAPRELHVLLLLLCGCCAFLLAEDTFTSTTVRTVTEPQSISKISMENGTSITTKENTVQLSINTSVAPNVTTPATSVASMNSTAATSNSTTSSNLPTSNNTITHVTSPKPESNSTENSTQTIPHLTTQNRTDTNTSTDITEKPTVSTHWTTYNTTGIPQEESATPRNPGVIAVLCIFISILAIAAVVMVVKFCQNREPAFKKLDEVPMSSVSEDAPFARYPPK